MPNWPDDLTHRELSQTGPDALGVWEAERQALLARPEPPLTYRPTPPRGEGLTRSILGLIALVIFLLGMTAVLYGAHGESATGQVLEIFPDGETVTMGSQSPALSEGLDFARGFCAGLTWFAGGRWFMQGTTLPAGTGFIIKYRDGKVTCHK